MSDDAVTDHEYACRRMAERHMRVARERLGLDVDLSTANHEGGKPLTNEEFLDRVNVLWRKYQLLYAQLGQELGDASRWHFLNASTIELGIRAWPDLDDQESVWLHQTLVAWLSEAPDEMTQLIRLKSTT